MKWISTLFLILTSTISFAQLVAGAKGGITIPNITGYSEQSEGYISGKDGYGGIFVSFKLSPMWFIQPEINYSPQGAVKKGLQKIPGDAIGGIPTPPGVDIYADYKSTTKINYLEIPVLVKFIFGSKLKYFACFGPHIAFLLNANIQTEGNSQVYLDTGRAMPYTPDGINYPVFSIDNKTNITERYKTINAGVQGGLGIQFPIWYGEIFIESRAIIGLLRIQKYPEEDGYNQTNSLAFAAGYTFSIR